MNYSVLSAGLFIMVLSFFLFNAPQEDPALKEQAASAAKSQVDTGPIFSGYCEKVDEATAPTFQAPADNMLKVGDDDIDESAGKIFTEPSHCGGNRNQIGQETTYRLIRRNVPMSVNDVKKNEFVWDDSSCHFRKAEFLDVNISGIDSSKFTAFYPQISGEIGIDEAVYSRTRDRESNLMYFIDYGLIFLVHRNADGGYTELQGTTTDDSNEKFYLADVYQDIESERPDLPAEALACDTAITPGSVAATGSQIIEPGQQSAGDENQLQIKYFVFGNAVSSNPTQIVNGWGVHCKPAVYLYPQTKQLINVQVFPKGELIHTDPPYQPGKGWTINAYPNGALFTSHNSSPITHNYLYYESKLLDSEIQKPEKGWVIKPEELENLFNKILPKLGLNQKEQTDFMNYWLNKLPDSAYYFVGLVDKPQRDYLEALDVTPKPDTSIRFSLFFEALDQPKEVTEPIIETPKRTGFTLVDWGGMVKLHPNTPFTCSQ